MNASWVEKQQRAVTAAEQRWDMKYKNLEEDYNELEMRHATAQQALQSTKAKDAESALMVQVETLQRSEAGLRSELSAARDELEATRAGAAGQSRELAAAAGGGAAADAAAVDNVYRKGLAEGKLAGLRRGRCTSAARPPSPAARRTTATTWPRRCCRP